MFCKNLFPVSVLAAAALISGCASYDKVANQEVSVKSVPDEASVSINGQAKDKLTDTSFILNRNSDYVIEVSKAGYKTASIKLTHRATGETTEGAPRFELDKTDVSLTLEADPAVKAAADAKEAADKADAAKIAEATQNAVTAVAAANAVADKALESAKDAADLDDAESAVKASEKAAADAAEDKTDKAVAEAKEAKSKADAAANAAAVKLNAANTLLSEASGTVVKTSAGSDEDAADDLRKASGKIDKARALNNTTADKLQNLAGRNDVAGQSLEGTLGAIAGAKAVADEKAAAESKPKNDADAAAAVAAAAAAKQAADIEAAAKAQARADVAAEAAKAPVAPAAAPEADKVARLESELSETRAAAAKEQAALKEKISLLETRLTQAEDNFKSAAAAAPAAVAPAATAPAATTTTATAAASSKPVFARYAELRKQRAAGEITPDQYKAEIAKLAGK